MIHVCRLQFEFEESQLEYKETRSCGFLTLIEITVTRDMNKYKRRTYSTKRRPHQLVMETSKLDCEHLSLTSAANATPAGLRQ